MLNEEIAAAASETGGGGIDRRRPAWNSPESPYLGGQGVKLDESRLNRRSFLYGGLAAAASAAGPARAAISAGRRLDVIEVARNLSTKNRSRIAHADLIAVVDFGAPSSQPRFHLIDMVAGGVRSFLTAHGRGSDPAHSGWLKTFSNTPGSKATSQGAYRTGALYDGKYGRAMRLTGLDPENSNAEARAIVIHSAWYVSEAMVDAHGKLGRSEGCFALDANVLTEVLNSLGPDRLIYASRFDDART